MQKGIRNIVLGATPGQLTEGVADLRPRYRSASDGFRATIRPLLGLSTRDPSFRPYARNGPLKLFGLCAAARPAHDFVSTAKRTSTAPCRTTRWVRPRDTDSCSANWQLNALGIPSTASGMASAHVIPLAHVCATALTRGRAHAVRAPVNPRRPARRVAAGARAAGGDLPSSD
jgi:hypothetical protein